MKDGQIQDISTDIESSGVEDIMQIQLDETKKAIEEYIRNQLQEDIANDQISMKEYIDPFTGGKKKQIIEQRLQAQSEKVMRLADLFSAS